MLCPGLASNLFHCRSKLSSYPPPTSLLTPVCPNWIPAPTGPGTRATVSVCTRHQCNNAPTLHQAKHNRLHTTAPTLQQTAHKCSNNSTCFTQLIQHCNRLHNTALTLQQTANNCSNTATGCRQLLQQCNWLRTTAPTLQHAAHNCSNTSTCCTQLLQQ